MHEHLQIQPTEDGHCLKSYTCTEGVGSFLLSLFPQKYTIVDTVIAKEQHIHMYYRYDLKLLGYIPRLHANIALSVHMACPCASVVCWCSQHPDVLGIKGSDTWNRAA